MKKNENKKNEIDRRKFLNRCFTATPLFLIPFTNVGFWEFDRKMNSINKLINNDIYKNIYIPTIDISGEKKRHVIIAKGTKDTYQGHVDTVLLPDGKTMFATWAINHAGYLGPLSRSNDSGKTWSKLIKVPDNWYDVKVTTPTIHHLTDPSGKERIFVFGGQNFPGRLRQAYSEDGGQTWTKMEDTGLKAECPPKSILSFDGGKRLVMWCDRRDPNSNSKKDVSPVVWQSESFDGGLTWSDEKVVVEVPTRWAQPSVVRSPDGKQLLMLLRYNGAGNALFSTSDDNGQNWSKAKELPASLTGHRHVIRYSPDGRLVVVMRDTAKNSKTAGHYVAWVGNYDDIIQQKEGNFRIKLLHSNAGWDCGYSGLEILPDGTFVATTYVKYKPGPKKHSVVSVRFKLEEIDKKLKRQKG